jgi:hypothetical protein
LVVALRGRFLRTDEHFPGSKNLQKSAGAVEARQRVKIVIEGKQMKKQTFS